MKMMIRVMDYIEENRILWFHELIDMLMDNNKKAMFRSVAAHPETYIAYLESRQRIAGVAPHD